MDTVIMIVCGVIVISIMVLLIVSAVMWGKMEKLGYDFWVCGHPLFVHFMRYMFLYCALMVAVFVIGIGWEWWKRLLGLSFGLMLACVLMACGGGDDEKDGKTVLHPSADDDDEAVADDDDNDSVSYSTGLCGVTTTFVFRNGEGVETRFENGNDAVAIVDVKNTNSGGVVVQNCIHPHGKDDEVAAFSLTDTLHISVYLGETQYDGFLCQDLLFGLGTTIPLCEEMDIAFQ